MRNGTTREKNTPGQILIKSFLLLSAAVFLLLGLGAAAIGSEQPAIDSSAENGEWVEIGSDSASGAGISANSGKSWSPSLAVSPDGSPVISWEDNSGGGWQIYVRRWNGTSWVEMGSGSASAGGISANSGNSWNPSAAVKFDGSPIIAWEDDTGGDSEIYIRRWNGSNWVQFGSGSASGGGISANNGDSWNASLALEPGGRPYVAWEDNSAGNSEIYVRHWNGSSWAEVGSGSASGGGISNNSGNSWEPSLAVGPDGTPVVAWMDDSGGEPEIYVRHWNGSAWVELGSNSASGGGISNNDGLSFSPSLAVDAEGAPVVAWEDDSGGSPQIYVRRWNGAAWAEIGAGSASGAGISSSSGNSSVPSLAVSSDNVPVAAWTDDSGGDVEIYVRRWNGLSWVEMESGSATGGGISANSGGSWDPSLAISADGRPVTAWSDDSGGDWQIYVRRGQQVPPELTGHLLYLPVILK